jgi:hypothetical protein
VIHGGTIKHTSPYKNQFAAAEHQQMPHIHVIMMAANCCKKQNEYKV